MAVFETFEDRAKKKWFSLGLMPPVDYLELIRDTKLFTKIGTLGRSFNFLILLLPDSSLKVDISVKQPKELTTLLYVVSVKYNKKDLSTPVITVNFESPWVPEYKDEEEFIFFTLFKEVGWPSIVSPEGEVPPSQLPLINPFKPPEKPPEQVVVKSVADEPSRGVFGSLPAKMGPMTASRNRR